jgi:hypothetical protein
MKKLVIAALLFAGCSLPVVMKYKIEQKSSQKQWICDEYDYQTIDGGVEAVDTCHILMCHNNKGKEWRLDLGCGDKGQTGHLE